MSQIRLNLPAIEQSLRAVQRDFDRINGTLAAHRDAMSDQVLDNLLTGYGYLDRLLAEGVDPLARGGSQHLLRLNLLVLYGEHAPESQGAEGQALETARRFYDDRSPGSLRALMGWLADHQGEAVWRRAAGAYIHVVSTPQLFIEGNHRTGVLILSSLLCRAGQPPFVLTTDNAKGWLDPSSVAKGYRKRSLRALVGIPKLRKRLARFLSEHAERRFLC